MKLILEAIFYMIIALLLCVFGNVAEGNDVVTRYLVYPSSFTTAQSNIMKNYGFKDNHQPILKTNYSLAISRMSYPYYILTVSTTLPIENTALLALESLGKIKKLDTFHILNAYDGRLGGVVTTVSPLTVFMKEPEPFAVEITTP